MYDIDPSRKSILRAYADSVDFIIAKIFVFSYNSGLIPLLVTSCKEGKFLKTKQREHFKNLISLSQGHPFRGKKI